MPADPDARRDIAILPSREPLVAVAPSARVRTDSVYHRRGLTHALPDVWLRRDAAARVRQAAALLPPGIGLLLYDGWRPDPLQAALFDLLRDEIAARTGLTGDALTTLTAQYVASPRGDPADPAPHLTGGAVDLTLCDADGAPLDLGSPFDEPTERSATAHFEREGLSSSQTVWRDRRRLLCAVMTHVGFSNYPPEWWHFDIGNPWHHARVGGPARYGAVLTLPAERHAIDHRT